MRSSLFLSIASSCFFACLGVNAQSVLDSSKLPSCAFSCQKLTSAQSACVPPAQAATNQGTYQSCFCSAPSLTSLYSTPAGACDGTCSSSDQQKIQTWYVGLCTGGVVVTPAQQAPASTTTNGGSTATSGTTSGAASASSGAGSAGQNASANSSNSGGGSWISTHYGWVIFLIVVVLFLVLGLVGGIWLRRRYTQKRATRQFSSGTNLPAQNTAASPYGSGVLSRADGAYVGSSRNHPQMTMVPDAGSEAAFERYGGYSAPGSRGADRALSASPVPRSKRASLGTRRLDS